MRTEIYRINRAEMYGRKNQTNESVVFLFTLPTLYFPDSSLLVFSYGKIIRYLPSRMPLLRPLFSEGRSSFLSIKKQDK